MRGARWVGLLGLLAVVGCGQWCKNPCKPGAVSCPGAATICSDLQTDRLHCGACDRRCGEQETCRAGQCVACTITCASPARKNLDRCVCDCPESAPRCGNGCCEPERCCDGNQCCEYGGQCCRGFCCNRPTYCCPGGGCSDAFGNCDCRNPCYGGETCCSGGCCPVGFPLCCGTGCCPAGDRCLGAGRCERYGTSSTPPGAPAEEPLRRPTVPVRFPGR